MQESGLSLVGSRADYVAKMHARSAEGLRFAILPPCVAAPGPFALGAGANSSAARSVKAAAGIADTAEARVVADDESAAASAAAPAEARVVAAGAAGPLDVAAYIQAHADVASAVA